MGLILRELTAADEAAFFKGAKHWAGESPHWYSFLWQPGGMSYAEMLERLKKEAAGVELAPGRVPHTMLYAFLEGEIIGRVSIRHELNDHLRHRGGHIGYAVAPHLRRKGYATEMVRQGLEYCRKLGIADVMVTCADDNEPSWRIVEYFGGKLQDKIWDAEDEEMIRRYWIKI